MKIHAFGIWSAVNGDQMAKFRYQIWYKNTSTDIFIPGNLLRSSLILIIHEKGKNMNVIVPILASQYLSLNFYVYLKFQLGNGLNVRFKMLDVSWSCLNSIDNNAILLASWTPDSLSQFFPRLFLFVSINLREF